MTDGTKWCQGCQTRKSVEEFSVDKSRPDGLNRHCKKCRARSAKAQRDRAKASATKPVPTGPLQECIECHQMKPSTQFVYRCPACFDCIHAVWQALPINSHVERPVKEKALKEKAQKPVLTDEEVQFYRQMLNVTEPGPHSGRKRAS